MTRLIVPLQDLRVDMLALGGGKAVNLGVLLRAGLPVPPGFCLTTQAYAQAARGLPLDDPVHAREALTSRTLPAEVAEAVVAAYRRLNQDSGVDDAAVAVRSSATAEDLPFASFAGQQDTVLDVVGQEALLAAVRRCWASLWTDRAVAYRAANNIDPEGVQLAVVVQHMVPARVAGVLFTADPLTGRRARVVIDAAPGSGEAVVSGAVNPDHYVLATASGEVLSQQAHSGPGGCLGEQQLRRLAELGRHVESLYDGAPQDIEFAVDEAGQVWLLQARAITTLFPLPADAPPPDAGDDLRVYFSVNVAQGVLRPFTPMGQQLFRLAASGLARAAGAPPVDPLLGPRAMTVAGDRVFFDITPVVRSRPGRRLAGFALTRMEARSAEAVRALASDPRLSPLPGWPARAVARAFTLLIKSRAPLRIVRALHDPGGARKAALARVRNVLDAPLSAPGAGAEDRLRAAELALSTRIPAIAMTLLPLLFTGMTGFVFAFRLLGRRVSPEERDEVRRSLPHNPTTRMDLALWALADQVRGDADSVDVLAADRSEELAEAYLHRGLPPMLQASLGRFLAEHGHRGVAEIDLGLPRWAENPTQVLAVLAAYLRRPAGTSRPDEHFAAGALRAEALVEQLAGRVGPVRAPLVRFGLTRGRQLAGLREAPKEAVVALTARLRNELLVPLGAELAAGRQLERGDDLVFLDLREAQQLLRGADLSAEIRLRRERYDAEVRRRRVPRILLSDGTEPAVAPPAAGDGALRGAPASAGVATGPATVVLDPVGASLEPGQILVAPSTDPGWTPLFLTAAGLVMEMGGAMSHGAVVAREYGIPAVVGVPDATSRIVTGQRVTVDGGAGTVTIAGAADAADAAGGPAGALDRTWQPPKPGTVWVRRQVVEHMPGPLSPLFEALYVPDALQRGYERLFEEFDLDLSFITDEQLFGTVNGYAYARGDYDLPLRDVPKLLHVFRIFVPYVFRDATSRWRDQGLPAYLTEVQRWRDVDPPTMASADLLRGVRALADADAAYWGSVAVVVGAAKISDAALQAFLSTTLRGRRLTSGAFLRGYASKTLESDAALEALADTARASEELRAAVLETDPTRWQQVLPGIDGGAQLLAGLARHLREYGHQVFSLDFAEPTLAEEPAAVLGGLQTRVGQDRRDVAALRAQIAQARDAEIVRTAAGVDPLRRHAFLRVLTWAQRFAPYREEALFYLGAGWPTLRGLAAELGRRLQEAGALDDAADIYYLTPEEIAHGLAGQDALAPADLAERARGRRALQDQRRQLRAPMTVPPTGRMRMGRFDMSAWETARHNAPDAEVLRGFAVSPGRVTAPASVVLNPEQFPDMAPGSILVCPTTTPAWTPLLAQARGLVTDIGGVLAHGSLVAREYGIPAVLGTGSATARIRSGQMITVDGDRGAVALEGHPLAQATQRSAKPIGGS